MKNITENVEKKKILKLKETNHSYYCQEGNYYTNGEAYQHMSWDEFKKYMCLGENGEFHDHDYNHVFRFDIIEVNPEVEKTHGKYVLRLFYMLQRKARNLSHDIYNIKEEDMEEINLFLKSCWEYLKGQWQEFSEVE